MGSRQGGVARGPTAPARTLVHPPGSLFALCKQEGNNQQRRRPGSWAAAAAAAGEGRAAPLRGVQRKADNLVFNSGCRYSLLTRQG